MVHHYTSIQNLALILKSGNIRFSRLDTFDDIKEISGLPRKFGTYVYASCWTEGEEENIALWNMYTNMSGVRITLPKRMLKKYQIKAGHYGNFGYTADFESPLPIEKLRSDNYFISNAFWLEDGFYNQVIYNKDFKAINGSLIHEVNGELVIKGIQNLGRFKDTIWKFQKESRFTLAVFPLLPLDNPIIRNIQENQMKYMPYAISSNLENSFSFIDVELENEVLNNINLRLAPLCTESDAIIVNSLLKEYTKNGTVEHSKLKGTIRKR